MATVHVKSPARRATIEAVVTRCGCGNPAGHAGRVCPNPRQVENRGVVSFYHRNPFKRLWWKLTRRAAA
jgi:hypothetical protein